MANDDIPRSRLNLTYKTQIQGELQDVQLPFRMVVVGDLSGGTATDRKVDLDARQIRRLDGKNLDKVIEDMAMSLTFDVPNRVGSDGSDKFSVTLPIKSMRSFEPAEVAQNIPKVRALLLLKKLLSEVQANLDNRKEFRKMIRALPSQRDALIKQLAGFEDFKVPNLPPAKKATPPAAAAAASGGGAATGGAAPAAPAAPVAPAAPKGS